MKNISITLLLTAVLILSASNASAARVAFNIGAGDEGVTMAQITVTEDYGSAWGILFSAELAGSAWRWSPEVTSYSIGIMPVVTWKPTVGTYLEAGIGGMLMTNISAIPRLGSAFEFVEIIGAGVQHENFRLGYRLMHISNGGIKQPNGGYNTHIMSVRIGF